MSFTPKIQIVITSIRQGRNGEKVAHWLLETVQNIPDATFEIVDLQKYPMPLFEDAMPPMMRKDIHPNPAVASWLAKIGQADGYLFVTAEYNHSITGAFKNAIDYVGSEFKNKACGFIGYGGMSGGSRAIEHMRQIASELSMHDVRDQLLIPSIWSAFDSTGKLTHNDLYTKTAQTVTAEVITLATKLRA